MLFFFSTPASYLEIFHAIQQLSTQTHFYEIGWSGFLFLFFLKISHPQLQNSQDLFHLHFLEKYYFSSFLKAYLTGSGIIFFLLLLGYYQYAGYALQKEDTSWSLLSILLRTFTLLIFVYTEEFIFREKIRKNLSHWPLTLSIQLTALLYCGVKAIQFQLSWTQLFSLYLVSLFLSYQREKTNHFTHNAGYWAAILILYHVILSLPVLGQSFSGVFLIQYAIPREEENVSFFGKTLLQWLTGGAGGPLSSLIFQILLVVEIFKSMVSIKKS